MECENGCKYSDHDILCERCRDIWIMKKGFYIGLMKIHIILFVKIVYMT